MVVSEVGHANMPGRMPPKGTANANGDKEKKNVSAVLGNFQIIGCVQKLFS